jgi:hypothetical protein
MSYILCGFSGIFDLTGAADMGIAFHSEIFPIKTVPAQLVHSSLSPQRNRHHLLQA